jgi:hypothetical protein
MKRTSIIISVIILGVAIVGGATYANRSVIKDWWTDYNKADVPEAVSFDDISENDNSNRNTEAQNTNEDTDRITDDTEVTDNTEKNVNEAIVIPESINLAIPFTSQAPHANWDLPYQEACEEASMLMAARFLQGRTIDGANDADQAILQLVDHATNVMHYPIDSTAQETANILEDFYDLDTELIYNFTWEDVKKALAQGYPVILPAAGRQLGNPNFTSPGPIYHMLIIKGYTSSVVITNDPGTRKGADYQYSYDTLLHAAHDWNSGDVANGKKVIIVVKPKINE